MKLHSIGEQKELDQEKFVDGNLRFLQLGLTFSNFEE